MRLYPYQKSFVNSDARFEVHNKSRQIGFTESYGYRSVKRAYKYEINQLIVSSSQRQSNHAMSYVEKWLNLYRGRYGLKLTKDSATEKRLSNGKSIYCLPSKPETIRGFNGDVLIDEYALHKEDDKIYEALLPSIVKSSKYKISICSTPLGQSNMFYEIMTDLAKYPDFKRSTINCYDAIKQGCTMDIDTIKRNMDEESFRQEFMCEFIDEQTSYFPYELLKSVIKDYNEHALKGKNYGGIDIGRTKDRYAFGVVNKSDKYRLKALEVLHNKKFSVLFDTSCRMIEENDLEVCYVDKGLIGMQLAEELEDKYPSIVLGVQFTNMFKNELATYTKKLIENKDFEMYEHRDLISALHKIKKTVTPSNQVNFDSKRDEKGHADEGWAVMLANLASRGEQPSIKMAFSE